MNILSATELYSPTWLQEYILCYVSFTTVRKHLKIK